MIDLVALGQFALIVNGEEAAPQLIADALTLYTFMQGIQHKQITLDEPGVQKLAQNGTLLHVLAANARVGPAIYKAYETPQGVEALGRILISLRPS